MGVNADARVGDMAIVVSGNTRLFKDNPDVNYDVNYGNIIDVLEAGTHCVILEKVTAGSSKMGHVFMVFANNRLGWLWNHDLMVWYDVST